MTAIEPRAGPVRRLDWRRAQVREVIVETSEDGYQAQRSYSIASPPEDELMRLTVERVENGEVSPYLVEELAAAINSNCEGRSAATSYGPPPSAALSVSSQADPVLRL